MRIGGKTSPFLLSFVVELVNSKESPPKKGTSTMNFPVSRRGFIAACAGVAATLLHNNSFAVASQVSPVPRKEQIRSVLLQLGAEWDVHETRENRDNLNYAYQTIKPSNHTEAAIVVWAGDQRESVVPLIKEYCQRRNGGMPQIFDHPKLRLRTFCHPNTQWVLIFREQLDFLAFDLAGCSEVSLLLSPAGCFQEEEIPETEDAQQECDLDTFRKRLSPISLETLSASEIEGFYLYMKKMHAVARSYIWCSSLVEQALVI